MATLVAGEQYHELDGQLLEIKRQLRQSAGYPYDPAQLKVALQNAIEGKFGEIQKQSLLSVVATTQLGAVAGKSTKRCFVGGIWSPDYRDKDIDSWFPANQPNAGACIISTLAPAKDWTFAEAVVAVLGVSANTPTKAMGELLIKRGHTVTLPQDEEMAEKTERGEKTGMRTDTYGNFGFVETGDPEDPVSVGYVYRGGRDWRARVVRLDRGFRWRADARLLVRNLDASKLGL